MKKLHIYIWIEFPHYPQIFYRLSGESIDSGILTVGELVEKGFVEVDYENHSSLNYEINNWLNTLVDVQIGGNTVAEILQYDDISLWQFAKEYISKFVRMPIKLFLYLNNLMQNTKVDAVQIYSNSNLPTIKDVSLKCCEINKIELERYIIYDKLNSKTPLDDIERGSRKHIRDLVLSKRTSYDKGRVLFLGIPSTEAENIDGDVYDPYIDMFVEYFSEKKIDSYRMLLPSYYDVAQKRRYIEEMISMDEYDNLFFDEFYDDKIRLMVESYIPTYEKIAQTICSSDEFISSMTFQTIDLYSIGKDFLYNLISKVLPYQGISSLMISKKIVDTLEPHSVFLTNETSNVSRALTIAAHKKNIPVYGITHGNIFKEHFYYLDKKTQNYTDEQSANLSFIIPKKTFVFGEYYKDNLCNVGSHRKKNVAVLPNWIAMSKMMHMDETILHKLKIYKKYILFLSSVTCDDEYLEYVLQNTDFYTFDLVIKVHPLTKQEKISNFQRLCSKYGAKPVITKDYFFELVSNAKKIVTFGMSTSVLDCMQIGRKPFVFYKYLDFTAPWLEIALPLKNFNDSIDTLLTKEEMRWLEYYGIGNLEKNVFNNVLKKELDKDLYDSASVIVAQ